MKDRSKDDKVACRTPAEGRDGVTNIPRWKYEAVRKAILAAVQDAGPEGLAFKDMKEAVRVRMTEEDLADLGALGWHMTTVKLNMEVDGELSRVAKVSPQRIVLAP